MKKNSSAVAQLEKTSEIPEGWEIKTCGDKLLVVTILLILIVISSSPCWAQKTPEFEMMVAQKITNDCAGQELLIKQGYSVTDPRTGKELSKIEWPYSAQLILGLIRAISQSEPFPRYTRNQGGYVKMGAGASAEGFLKCGDHVLDVNYDDWYWDGVKLEAAKSITNFEVVQQGPGSNYARTAGNNSPAVAGSQNQTVVSQRGLSLFENAKFSLGITLAFSLSLPLNFYLMWELNRRRKKK